MKPPGDDWAKLIGGERSWIAMQSAGSPGAGSPALVRFQAVSCAGERKIEIWGAEQFAEQLQHLVDNLSGEANASSMEGDFKVCISSIDEQGHLCAEVVISEMWGNEDWFELRFNVPFDQSLLPSFLTTFKSSFEIGGQ